MKHLHTYIYILILLLLTLTKTHAQQTKTPIDVGMIVSLSGSMQQPGDQMIKGVNLALSETDTYPMNIIYEDDRSMENPQAVKAAQRLVNSKKVKVVLNWVNTTLPAIAPILERSKTPAVAIWDSNKGILKMGKYIFAIGISTEATAIKIADHIFTKAGKKKIALISLNDPWSEIVASSFKNRMKELGGEILIDDIVNPSDKDLMSILTRAKAKGADVIFAPLFFDSLHAVIRQTKELKFEAPVYTADAFFESELEVLKDLANGVYSAQLVVNNEKFLNEYKIKYGSNDSSVSIGVSALAYDAIKMLSEIFKKLESSNTPITNETIREELTRTRYQGVTGLSAPAEESTKVESIVVVKDGKFVEVN